MTRKDFDTAGGVAIVEMCSRTNIIALVGGRKEPRYPRNKVMMWDNTQDKCIGELSFSTDVKGVKLRRDLVVVALDQSIYIYKFQVDVHIINHICFFLYCFCRISLFWKPEKLRQIHW